MTSMLHQLQPVERPPGGVRHLSHAGEFLDTPSALSLLINLAGKMRMLSHRIALIILAGKVQDAAAPGHDAADAQLEASLNEFRLIHAALSEGSP